MSLLGDTWYFGYRINVDVVFDARVHICRWSNPKTSYAKIVNSEYISPPKNDPGGEKLRALVAKAIERQKRIVD